jgi:iron complex transport system substrate-binding protein
MLPPLWAAAALFVLAAPAGSGAANESAESTTTASTTAPAVPAAARISYTDDAGRTHSLPKIIRRVYSTSPVANTLLYALAPERMIGWNYKLHPRDTAYLLPAVRKLPELGGWYGPSGTGNREVILAARPDIVLSVGYNNATSADFADRLQKQTGIPVLNFGGRLDETAATLEKLGALLDAKDRAAALAAYCREALAEARTFAANIPPERRLRVYYAEGPRGLQTAPSGSLHTELIEICGAENIVRKGATDRAGRADVSLDHILAWKPDAILISPDMRSPALGWKPEWLAQPAWHRVKAVATGRVYVIPVTPFNWFGRPPSVNRFLGLKWTAWALYPDLVKFDMVAETRKFYRLFYHYEMSEAEARAMLRASRSSEKTPPKTPAPPPLPPPSTAAPAAA